MLRLNGYPSNMISGTLNRNSHSSQVPQSDKNGPNYVLPRTAAIGSNVPHAT